MKKRARLTKRLFHLYQKVLEGGAQSWFWPHPVANPWWSGRPPSKSAAEDSWAWQAYLFAKEWQGREGVDLKRLERIVCAASDPQCMFLFARDVRGARVRRIERSVVRCGDPAAIRRFMRLPGANRRSLERLLVVAEVMRS